MPRYRRSEAGERVPGKARIWVGQEKDAPRVRITGPALCGSPNGCPVCSLRKRERAADELKSIVARWRARGGLTYLLTLTVRHDVRHDPRLLVMLLRHAWSGFTEGGGWRGIQARLELEGHTHALEMPYGRGGWHPHYHALLLVRATDAENPAGAWKKTRQIVRQAWLRSIDRALDELHVPETERATYRPSARHAIDLRRCDGPGTYIVKLGLSAQRDDRVPGARSRSAWEIMRSAAQGNPRDRRLWKEFTHATAGQQLPRLAPLRRLVESTGSRAADAKMGQTDELVAVIPAETYNALERLPRAVGRLRALAVRYGLPGVAIVVAHELLGVATADPADPPPFVRDLIERFRPPGGARDPSLDHAEASTPRHPSGALRRARRIVVSVHRRRLEKRRRVAVFTTSRSTTTA